MAKAQKKAKKMMKNTAARMPSKVVNDTASLASTLAKSASRPAAVATSSSATLTQMTMMYLTFLLGNAVVVYGAAMIFPTQVVLGTDMISPFMGLFYSMVVFTLIGVGLMPVIQMGAQMLNYKMNNNAWLVAYLVINVASLWLVARFAELLGMGIASWVVALVLGAVINVVQMVLYKVSTPKM